MNRRFHHYLNNPDIAVLAIGQNLNLHSITQTEKLARLIADRLTVGVTQVGKVAKEGRLSVLGRARAGT